MVHEDGMSAVGFFYLLVEDNRTSSLAGSEPPWGRPLSGLPADGDFHMTDWHDIAHGMPQRAQTLGPVDTRQACHSHM